MATAICRLQTKTTGTLATRPVSGPCKSVRGAYFPGHGHVEARVCRFETMETGQSLAGPAIVESSVTAVVLPPGSMAVRRQSGSLANHARRVSEANGERRERHGQEACRRRRAACAVEQSAAGSRAQDGEYLAAHRPLGRAQHRPRLFLCHCDRRLRAARGSGESSDSRSLWPRPHGQGH